METCGNGQKNEKKNWADEQLNNMKHEQFGPKMALAVAPANQGAKKFSGPLEKSRFCAGTI